MQRPNKIQPAPAPERKPELAPSPASQPRWRQFLASRRPVFWVVVGLLLVIGFVWAIRPSTTQAPRGGRFAMMGPMPVVTAKVETGEIPVTLNALGTVTPLATVTVKTQINGHLTKVAFQEGQHVNVGDSIAEVDPRPYQAALDQAQGQLAKDQALLKNAELDLTRFRTLLKQDSIASQQVDTQASLVRQYQGQVQADQAQVDTAKLNLSYCHIIAPVSGRVGLRLVDLGNYITPGDATGIVVITQLQPITVLFSVPQDNLQTIMSEFQSGTPMMVSAYDRNQQNKVADGKLTVIDNQIDTATGTVRLRAQFDNTDEKLFPNQFVNVRLLVRTVRDAKIVPSSAVQRGAPGTFVYVVQPDNTVKIRTVQLGPGSGERVSIQSGLELGETVVTDGADRLRDGAPITLAGAGAAQNSTNGADGKAGPSNGAAATGAPNAGAPNGKNPDGQHRRRNGQQQQPAQPAQQ